ncbi:hypothetical protein [Vulgatibacter incomptus]|uniref:Uncharacterized protein n=1 Tax=Vulgatibacter incomptus TaxID=1391653 RepID=A0A0K1PD23_9BACT|nr:hypothetical protein [Vulgatibacter incomptus]AKU91420.1 hypothetical protein AKJ08_1807 [Vulgatibacter incomptus]
MVRFRKVAMAVLGFGLMALPLAASAQAEERNPGEYEGGFAGACPMGDATAASQKAIQEGSMVRVESTPDGAVVRFSAPAQDPQALQDARNAAQKLGQAAQARQGCNCPGGEQGPRSPGSPAERGGGHQGVGPGAGF